MSDYDLEMPQSHTADQPNEPLGRDTAHEQSHDSKNIIKVHYTMTEVCLLVILALNSHNRPRAKALWPIWLLQCQYDLEVHIGHIITCM